MQPLALLCNLHAEGPTTFDLLRHTGVETLAELLEVTPEDLAARLGWSPALATRFLLEGRLLARRLEVEPRAPEVPVAPDPDPPSARGLALPEEEPPEEAPTDEPPSVETPREEPPPARDPRRRERGTRLQESLLGTWRELDDEDPPPELLDEPPGEPRDLIPRPPAPSRERSELALEEARDWIPADVAVRLARAGAHDLRSLAETDPLDLADRAGIGYTRLLRLQKLARRTLGGA